MGRGNEQDSPGNVAAGRGTLRGEFEKRFRRGPVVRCQLTQPVDRASVTVLLGPSGCGKTTVLRCLAGLERPEAGRIDFAGDVWFDAASRVHRSPQHRSVGLMSQQYALFPHLRVADNIGYGLRPLSAQTRRGRVGDLLERFELEDLAARYPHEISGGQQQRVALARALARRPRLLLLDEPLSALDAGARQQMRRQLRWLLGDLAAPVVLVTHDRSEAIALADQVVVMDGGRMLQAGSVEEVFSRPADLAVARIVGIETVVPVRVQRVESGLATLVAGATRLTAVVGSHVDGPDGYACIRAEEVVLQREPPPVSSIRNQLSCRVKAVAPDGQMVRIDVDCGFALAALVTRPASEQLGLRVGDAAFALFKAHAVHLVPRT